MSLQPSDWVAAQTNPGRTLFPNLACHQPTSEDLARIDQTICQELNAAEIQVSGPHEWMRRGEVPSAYLGEQCEWSFERAWYYWIAKGPGVPAAKAQAFWLKWGKEVRVNGGGSDESPLKVNHGFGISHYHIDTAEGLVAFAQLLKSIYQP